METSTKQDILIFFGITFAALAAFIFNINYVNPIAGFGMGYTFLLATLTAGIITFLKYDLTKIVSNITSLFTIVALINWISYFRNSEK